MYLYVNQFAVTNAEIEFLDIILTKDSSLLLHAIHNLGTLTVSRPFTGRPRTPANPASTARQLKPAAATYLKIYCTKGKEGYRIYSWLPGKGGN
jgi:hypothetical protein